MNVLMISTDRHILEPGSEVRSRMAGYAAAYEGLYIVVLGREKPLERVGTMTLVGMTRLRAWGWRPKEKFDLVTAQDPFETGLIGRRLSRAANALLELQVHTDFLSPYFERQSLKNWLRVRIALQLLPRADKVRVVSRRIADSLTKRGVRLKSSPEVRPIAIDEDRIRDFPVSADLHKKYPRFKKIILMASRLTKEKNIPLALGAMALLAKKRPDIGLVVVGSGPERVSETANVAVLPWADRDTLISYYKTANLFLLTSWYEGYGMTLAEARAAGCPIISTDVGVAREVGATITSYEPAALAELIIKKL